MNVEPIGDDEVLYRRIPVSTAWYADKVIYGDAFQPRKDEHTGISLFRDKFRTVEEVAKGKAKQGYYVASLRVSDLRRAGIIVEPRPDTPEGWDNAHVEIPGLNAGNRQTNEAEELQSQLAEIAMILPVAGKFVTTE